MTTTIKPARDLSGTTVDARVEAVFDYGATLSFSDGKAQVVGYLRVSQLQSDYLPSIRDAISPGQIVRVQVLYWDGRHGCWETSAIAALRQAQALSSWPRGARCDVAIVDLRDKSFTVRFPDGAIGIVSKQYQGNASFALEAAGRLDPGKRIRVVVGGWDNGGAGLSCRLLVGGDHPLDIGAVVLADILAVMPSQSPKRPGCHRIYAETDHGHILRVVPLNIMDPRRVFPVGSRRAFRIGVARPNTGTYAADPAEGWDRLVPDFGKFPDIGTECDVVIQSVWRRRLLCLVADGCSGVLDATTVVPDPDADMQGLFARCDTIRVRIVGLRSEPDGRRTADLHFVKLVSRRENFGPATVESELRDLSVQHQTGSSSGFARDARFRSMVREAYAGRCAFCKRRWTFGDFEAIEAAHIIPRACRGADTLQNAVALCPLHHWAFDKGLVCVDSDRTIRVSSRVFSGDENHALLTDLHGEEVLLPDSGAFQADAYDWHRCNVFIDVTMSRPSLSVDGRGDSLR